MLDNLNGLTPPSGEGGAGGGLPMAMPSAPPYSAGALVPGNQASFPPQMLRFMGAVPPPMPREVELLTKWAGMPNAAADPEISEETLSELSQTVNEGYERDLASRSRWEEIADKAMEAADQTEEGKNYPFPNAANVRYPLITIAALQFNARAYPAICSGRDIVKAKVGGSDQQGQKATRAQRVASFMSHQITDGMPGWEHEMDILLYQEPILGAAFKKSYWNTAEDKPESKLISAYDLVVNECTTSILTCPRISQRFELYPYQIEERQRAKTFLDVDLSDEYDSGDMQEPVEFIEQHCYFDLDGDGFAEPWIVTQTLKGQQLVRIVAGFDPLDIVHDGQTIVRIPREDYFSPFNFLPNPKGGFYGIGFGHLLNSFSEVINSSFNQMLDAGNLQTAGGGFIGSGLDFQSEEEEFRFEPGKYYTVNNEAGDIKNNIINVDHPGPSSVMFQLLGMMMESAKQITNTQDILTGAAGAQTMQPTTFMSLVDQGMKVFTAIYKRVYDSLSFEFRNLYRLNRKYLTDEAYSAYLGYPASVQADFADDGCLVTPVADPNSVTMMQRMAQAGFLKDLANDPIFGPMLNKGNILQRVLAAANIDDVQSLILPPPPPTPADQIPLMKAMADIDKTKSEAAHNFALASRENSQGEHFQAKTADLITGHLPDFFNNPPTQ